MDDIKHAAVRRREAAARIGGKRMQNKLKDGAFWLMGIHAENQDLAVVRRDLSCDYDACPNRGNFSNCYMTDIENCHHYSGWIRDKEAEQ